MRTIIRVLAYTNKGVFGLFAYNCWFVFGCNKCGAYKEGLPGKEFPSRWNHYFTQGLNPLPPRAARLFPWHFRLTIGFRRRT